MRHVIPSSTTMPLQIIALSPSNQSTFRLIIISHVGEVQEKSESSNTAKAYSSDIKNDEHQKSHSNISECKAA